MIIVGYSPIGGQNGVSSSMAVFGAWNYFARNKSVLLIQTGFSSNLEETLLGMRKKKKEGFFEIKGIDELVRAECAGLYGEDVLERTVITLQKQEKRFDLLPSTTKQNEQIYEQELLHWLPKVLVRYEHHYDFILVDISWKQKELIRCLKEYGDLCFVFLSQNRWLMEQLEWHTWEKKEHIILSQYYQKAFMNYRNLKLFYPSIGKRLLGTIPFQYQYMDSWSKGNALEYFLIEHDRNQYEKNFFWKEVEKIGRKIERKEFGGTQYRKAV